MAKALTHVLGVDLGTRTIKIVELRRQGQDIVLASDPVILPTPDGAVDGGQVIDSNEVAAALRDALRQHRMGTRKVITAVAGDPMVIVRVAEMARLTGRDLEDAVKFEIGRHSQFPIEELYYDYAIIEDPDAPPDAENMEVLLAAAHEEVVNSTVKAIMDARLQPVGVDVQPLAIARSALLTVGPGGVSQTIAAVHIGETSTVIVMIRKGEPNFVRFLPNAGQTLTDAIIKAGITDSATAERVKKAFTDLSLLAGYEGEFGEEESVFEVSDSTGMDTLATEGEEVTQLDVEATGEALEAEPEEGAETGSAAQAEPQASERSPEEQEVYEQVATALEQPIVDLATEIRRSIDFYRRQHRNEPVDRVVISGGSALLGGLPVFLEAELGIRCQLSNPFASISAGDDPQRNAYLAEIGPVIGLAIGLAARDMVEQLVAVRGQ